MADYTIRWAPITNPANLTGELPVSTFSWTDTLNSPGSLTGVFPLNPYPGSDAQPLTTDTFKEGATVLWVVRDEEPVWSGVLWGWDADPASDQVRFQAEGWHSYLRRVDLFVYPGSWEGVDQATIVADLIDTVATVFLSTTGNTFIVEPPTVTTGVTRDYHVYWWDPKYVADIIDHLASLANGFDFRYRTFNDAGVWRVVLELTYPAFGDITSHVFDLESNIVALRASSDGKNVTVYITEFGSGQGSQTITASANTGTLLANGWPYTFASYSHPDVVEGGTLAAHLARDVARSSTPIRLLEVEVWPDTVPALTEYRVGDIVHVNAQRGFLQLPMVLHRITSRTVDVDPGGNETVKLGLAPAAMFDA